MAQKLKVTLHDGRELVVQPTLEDTLNFETTLRKNPGWGNLAESIQRQWAFKAWSLLKRTGQIEQTWSEFSQGENAAIEVTIYDEDEEKQALDGNGDPVIPDEDDAAIERHTSGKSGTRGRSTAPSSPSLSVAASQSESGSEQAQTT